MARKSNPETDFVITLDGVGEFKFGRRTIGDAMRIRARFLELAGAHQDDVEMVAIASAIATYEVLVVSHPDGWGDLMSMDAVSPEHLGALFDLYGKLGDKEDSFRGKTQVNGTQEGAGNS